MSFACEMKQCMGGSEQDGKVYLLFSFTVDCLWLANIVQLWYSLHFEKDNTREYYKISE